MQKRRLGPGEFVEVATPKGVGYLRLFGVLEGPLAAEIFAVLKNPTRASVPNEGLPELEIAYFVGSSQDFFKEDPRVTVRPGPEVRRSDAPPVWRTTTLRGWRYLKDGIESPPREIDDEMATLPIASMVPLDLLIDRMVLGWSPDLEREDGLAKLSRAVETARASNEPKVLTVLVDFETPEHAIQASVLLKRRGFHIETRSGGSTLAVSSTNSRAMPNWIEQGEEQVLSLSRPFGGRYGGNELEV